MSLTDSMTAKLSGLTDRYEEVSALLADPDVMANREQLINTVLRMLGRAPEEPPRDLRR